MRATDVAFVKLNFGKGQHIGQLSIVHVQHQVNLLAFLGNGRLSMIKKQTNKQKAKPRTPIYGGVGNQTAQGFQIPSVGKAVWRKVPKAFQMLILFQALPQW